jgi:hypothetical protein
VRGRRHVCRSARKPPQPPAHATAFLAPSHPDHPSLDVEVVHASMQGATARLPAIPQPDMLIMQHAVQQPQEFCTQVPSQIQ